MPDIASALKSEIARIARREARSETAEIKRGSAQHRAHIAGLRRRIDELERALKQASKQHAERNTVPANADENDSGVQRRFSPTRLAATRKKLGLSAADFGSLIGVTGQSIYKWEAGAARPRAKQLQALAAVRGIGKREAAARLRLLRRA